MSQLKIDGITWYDGGKLFPAVKPDGGHDIASEDVLINRHDGIFLGHYNFTEQFWHIYDGHGSATISREGQSWRYRWEKPYIEPTNS